MTFTESNQSIRADRYNTLRQRLENSDFDIDIKDIPSLTDRESNFSCLKYLSSSRFRRITIERLQPWLHPTPPP